MPARPNRTAEAIEIAGVRLSSPDKVLWPEQGLTKHGLALHYLRVAPRMLPVIAGRPLTLLRCPAGRRRTCFFQCHADEDAPPQLGTVRVSEAAGTGTAMTVKDTASLIALVQMGMLEIHGWPARADRLDRPDRLVFDLDPAEDVGWAAVIEGAGAIRARLADLGLGSVVQTTGGKGLHVIAPVARCHDWETHRAFARAFAEAVAAEAPDRYVATMSRATRRGRLFVDWLRNARGATAIAAWSTRARANAPVAVPLSRDELYDPRLRADRWTVATLAERLERPDPWHDAVDPRQPLGMRALRTLGIGV